MTRTPFFGSAQPDDSASFGEAPKAASTGASSSAPDGASSGGRALEGHDLGAALQLLVERAQYITGATGAALALAQGQEMVCRAIAGSCAPPVGARLQVRSGLTGESVSRKQLLRCDNAENDPRVNLETCRELGIASIVVLPLLSPKGEVRGLFELFSDHPYAFEERDLIALERMAELTRTALDLAEKTAIVIPPKAAAQAAAALEHVSTAVSPHPAVSAQQPQSLPMPELAPLSAAIVPQRSDQQHEYVAPGPPASETPTIASEQPPLAASQAVPAPLDVSAVPESMRRIQKCGSCGFPVSEGRTLCMDCEEKQHRGAAAEEIVPAEYVPSFGLSNSNEPVEESWLANHVNLLAILVLILSIVVAVVVFR